MPVVDTLIWKDMRSRSRKNIRTEITTFFHIPGPVLGLFALFLAGGLVAATITDIQSAPVWIWLQDIVAFLVLAPVMILAFRDRMSRHNAFAIGVLVTLYLFILGGVGSMIDSPGRTDANYLISILVTIVAGSLLSFMVGRIFAIVLGSLSSLYVLVAGLLFGSPLIRTHLPLLMIVAIGSSVLCIFYRTRLEHLASRLITHRQQAETSLDELQSAQKRIVTQEKLATLGALVSGISHELRNPLNFINNFSEITGDLMSVLEARIDPLLVKLPPESQAQVKELMTEIHTNLMDISTHGKRGTSIIQSMLMHHRGEKSESRPANFNELVRQAAELALHGYKARERFYQLDLEMELDPAVGSIRMVAHEINRVILNICANAFYETHRRARMESEGTFRARVWITSCLVVDAEGEEGSEVELTIRDNGNGIPPEYLDRIFLPFFTSKPTGDGTGLGLSMAWEIITSGHNGTLTAANHPDGGAIFTITLPAIR